MDGMSRRLIEQIRRRAEARALQLEQGELALYAPAVAGQGSVAAHDTVTGNRHCQRIGRACLAHLLGCAGRTDAPRNLAIGLQGTGRYGPEGLPYAPAELASPQIERQVEPGARRSNEVRYPGEPPRRN